jgi:hypothetical protein
LLNYPVAKRWLIFHFFLCTTIVATPTNWRP